MSQPVQDALSDTGLRDDFAAAMQTAITPAGPALALQDRTSAPQALGSQQSVAFKQAAPGDIILASNGPTDACTVRCSVVAPVERMSSDGQAEELTSATVVSGGEVKLQTGLPLCNPEKPAKPVRNREELTYSGSSPLASVADTAVAQPDRALGQPDQALPASSSIKSSDTGNQPAAEALLNNSLAEDPLNAEAKKSCAVPQAQAGFKAHRCAIEPDRPAQAVSRKSKAVAVEPAADKLPATQFVIADRTASTSVAILPLLEVSAKGTTGSRGQAPEQSRSVVAMAAACVSPAPGIAIVEAKQIADDLPAAAAVHGYAAAEGKMHASEADAADIGTGNSTFSQGVSAFGEQLRHSIGLIAALCTPANDVSFSQSMGRVSGVTYSAVTRGELLSAVEGSRLDGTGSTQEVYSQPMRRLEVAVEDSSLGVINVRAEMRAGVLHASLAGVPETMLNVAPALHQFLQENQVSVHTLRLSQQPQITAPNVTSTPTISQLGMGFGDERGSNPQQPAHTPTRRAQAGRQYSQDEAWLSVVPQRSSFLNYTGGGGFHDGSSIATVSIHI